MVEKQDDILHKDPCLTEFLSTSNGDVMHVTHKLQATDLLSFFFPLFQKKAYTSHFPDNYQNRQAFFLQFRSNPTTLGPSGIARLQLINQLKDSTTCIPDTTRQ